MNVIRSLLFVLLLGATANAEWETLVITANADTSNVPSAAMNCYVTVHMYFWDAMDPDNNEAKSFSVKLNQLYGTSDYALLYLPDGFYGGWWGGLTIRAQNIGVGTDGKSYKVSETTYDMGLNGPLGGYDMILDVAPNVVEQ